MKKLFTLFAMLALGISGAWADDYVQLLNLDFEDADTYNSGWTAYTSTSKNIIPISQGTRTLADASTSKTIFFDTQTKGRGAQYNFGSLIQSTDNYKLGFDFAGTDCVGSDYSCYLQVRDVTGNALLTIKLPSNSSTGTCVTTTVYAGGTSGTSLFTFDCDSHSGSPTTFHTFVITGDPTNGIKVTMDGGDSYTVSATNAKIGSIIMSSRSSNGGDIALDNLIFSRNATADVTRMSAANTTATSIASSKMNADVKTALTTAQGSEYVSYSASQITSSNIANYVAAIEDLETAVANAQTSIADYALYKAIYDAAKSKVDALSNEDVSTAFTTATATDLTAYTEKTLADPAAAIKTVKTALATALVSASDGTSDVDMTSVIYNNDFELGNANGWTYVKDTNTEVNTYTGSYEFTMHPNGYAVYQNLGTLPAGTYTLTAEYWSNGAPMYLYANSDHSDVFVVNGDKVAGSYEFTLAEAAEVTIGTCSGDNSTQAWVDGGGYWWYRVDNFKLTYTVDQVAIAKTSLEAEIETATTLKDSWTAKVGSTPFKYDATYYDALVSQITSATTTLNSGSETVSDYTDAETALETAETNMSSSTQNAPDPDKYYRLYVADSNGAATDYNLNLAYASVSGNYAIISATPYAVKFASVSGGYTINNTYGSAHLCVSKSYYYNALVSDNVTDERQGTIAITLQDNGSVKLSSSKSGVTYIYSGSALEGSTFGALAANTGTWVVSDAVEVTSADLAISSLGWGTFIAPYNDVVPANVTAYTVTVENGALVKTEVTDGKLAANTPYLLKAEADDAATSASKTCYGIATNGSETLFTEGALVGNVGDATYVAAGNYLLQYNNSKLGFYKVATDNSLKIGTNRCYLTTGSNAKEAYFFDEEDTPTAVAGVEAAETTKAQTVKYIKNGQLVIETANGTFNAAGARIK